MLIYLASPYTSPDKDIEDMRCTQVQRFCAEMARRSIHVVSPIAHWHPIRVRFILPGDHLFWKDFDRKLLHACEEMWILTLDGWTASVGVQDEIKMAREYGKPIKLVDPISLFTETFRI